MYILLVLRCHPLGHLLRKRLDRIDGHRIAIGRATRDSNPRKSVPRLVPLPRQPRNDANRSIVLVQSRRELLTGAGQLLLQVIRLERQRVPFVLEGREEGGDRCQRWGSWPDNVRLGEGEEVVGRQGFAGSGLGAILRDVLFDEALLEDGALA